MLTPWDKAIAALIGACLPLLANFGFDLNVGEGTITAISGVAALVLSANPELTAWRVKQILEATATDLPPKGKDPNTGAGLANALKAVQMAIKERK